MSGWTLRFRDKDRETAYQYAQYSTAGILSLARSGKSGRTLFLAAYVATWVLMVLSTVGAYGLNNLSLEMLTLQLAVLGALGAGALLVWMVSGFRQSGKLQVHSIPVLFLWATLCYAFADERFSMRIATGEYTGSMSSSLLPIAALFLLLPEATCNRFLLCFLTACLSLLTVIAFQIAGVRVNSGLVDAMIYAIVAAVGCWRAYIAERAQRADFYCEAVHPAQGKEELDTWGLVDDSASESDALLKKLKEAHVLLSGTAAVATAPLRERLKTAMLLLNEVGKDLASRSRSSDLTVGIVTKTVDSEYRMLLEEKFLPVQRSTPRSDHPRVHPIMYGSQELTPMLNQLEKNWNFDVFFLAQISGLRPLEVTGGYCMKRYGLDSELQLSEPRLQHFLQELESKYKPNPYHNSTHAADVLNSLLFLYKQSEIFKEISDLELLASIVAALAHDVGHPAFSNRYLINTRSSLALLCTCYADNDVSVLEMMHTALTYELLSQNQVLEHLEREQWMIVRRVITELILSTDMMKHFELLDTFAKKYAGRTLPLTEFEEKLTLYKMCIKCADIAHAAKAVELHEKWTMRVVEEFFHQGDLEREQNLPISMFCDRLSSDLPKNQSGFIINVVKPLFLAVNSVVKSKNIEECVLLQLDKNLEFWKSKMQKRKRASVAPAVVLFTRTEEDEEQKEMAESVERAATRVAPEERL